MFSKILKNKKTGFLLAFIGILFVTVQSVFAATEVGVWYQTAYSHDAPYYEKQYYKVVSYDNNTGNATVQLRDEGGLDYAISNGYNCWVGDNDIYVDGKWKATWKFPRRSTLKWTSGANNQYYDLTGITPGKHTITLAPVNLDSDVVTAPSSTFTIDVPYKTFNNKVYARYENADGTWSDYSLVYNKDVTQGTSVSWSRAADSTYEAASISYSSSGVAKKYVDVYRKQAYFDLNGYLDGSDNGGLGSYGTADVYVNGSLVSNDCTDFYQKLRVGSTFEVKDVKATSGHVYNGVQSGSVSGTMSQNGASVRLSFSTLYTLTIDPNGGTWNGKTSSTSISVKNGGQYELGEIPTRKGYTFVGWKRSGSGSLHSGDATSWRNDAITMTEKADSDGTAYTNYTMNWSNASTGYNWPSMGFFSYNYVSGHTYRVDMDIRVNSSSGLGYSHIRHSAFGNNWEATASIDLNSTTNGWVHRSMSRTFTGTTVTQNGTATAISPLLEFYCSIAPGSTGSFNFDLKNITVYDETAGKYVSSTGGAKNGARIDMGAGNTTVTAVWKANTYKVNYNANGGTGTMSSDTVSYGSDYKTKQNAFTRTGYTFKGWNEKADGSGTAWNLTSYGVYESGKSWTWTYTNDIILYAQWEINTYTNVIQHWAGGFKNQEGNNGDKSWFSLGTTNYTKQYQGSYTLNSNDSITPPNGYYLQTNFGTANITGSWGSYDMPYTGKQIAQNMYFEYYYSPYTYTISYNLDGGTNDSSNPSSYNVLYGITLKNPTKKGYRFLGWYDGDTKVTGINEGATATFSSKDDMYSKLKTRITGNKTLTAKWQNITYYIDYDLNITGLTDQFADTLKDNNGSEAGRETALFDKTTTLQNPQSLTKYVFKGWNTKADGTGKMYTGSINQDGSVCEAGKTLKLYAIWDTTPNIEAKDFYLIEGVEAPADVARTGVGFDKTPTSKYPDQMKKVAYPIKGTTKNGTDISDRIKIDYIEYNGSKVSTIDTNKTGTYTIHYSLTDGKNTKKFTRKTTVLPFSTPSINAGDKYFKRGSDITIDKLKENITANDKYDGDLVTEVEVDDMDKINNNVVGSYDIIYKVKNSSNKTTTKTVKVNIIDYLPDNGADNGNSFRYITKDCTEVNDYCMQYFDDTSKWKTDGALTEQIMDSLSKDSSSQAVKKYSFSSEEVEKAQKKQ